MDFTLLTRLNPGRQFWREQPVVHRRWANLRIADIRMMIDDEQSAPASSRREQA